MTDKTDEGKEESYDDIFDELSKAKKDGEEVELEDVVEEEDAGTEGEETGAREDDPPAKEPSEEPAPEEKAPGDWRQTLAPEAAKHLELVERNERIARHKLKSDDGRVSALQKQVNALQAELEKASTPKEKEALPDIEIPEDLVEFAKSYPKIADFVKGMTAQGMKTAVKQEPTPAKADERQPAVDKTANKDELTEEEARSIHDGLVREGVGNYAEIIAHQAWEPFLAGQPAYIRRLADSSDLGDLVALFKDHWDPYVLKTFAQKPEVNEGSATDEAANSTTKKADKVSKRREKTLDDVSVETRQSREILSNSDADDGSYDSAFNRAARAKQKERQQGLA